MWIHKRGHCLSIYPYKSDKKLTFTKHLQTDSWEGRGTSAVSPNMLSAMTTLMRRVRLYVTGSPRQLQNLSAGFEEVGDKRLSDHLTQLMREWESGAQGQKLLYDMGFKWILLYITHAIERLLMVLLYDLINRTSTGKQTPQVVGKASVGTLKNKQTANNYYTCEKKKKLHMKII